MDAGSWFHNKYAGEDSNSWRSTPIADRVGFQWSIKYWVKTDVIQYKGLVEKCLALQSAKDWPFASVYSSFNPYTLVELKKQILLKKLGFSLSLRIGQIKGCHAWKESYHPDLKLLDWTLEWNTNQLPLRVWTVNEDRDINRCFELQIEAIFTDYPQKALQLKRRTMSDKLPKLLLSWDQLR